MLYYKCDKCGTRVDGSHPYCSGYFQKEKVRFDFCDECWPLFLEVLTKKEVPKTSNIRLNLS